MTWPEFNRYCWRVYGTGRTAPDADAPPPKRSPITFIGTGAGPVRVVLPTDWPAFNRLCSEFFGPRRTYTNRLKEIEVAKNELTITVSIERGIHQALSEFLQAVWDEHKVRVDHISVDWFEADEVCGHICLANSVAIQSRTFASEPGKPKEKKRDENY